MVARTMAWTLVALGAVGWARADEDPFATFLDTESIGASAFRRAHPEWDGRGVVIAVLDTGVDMGVQGLQTTPGGDVKVLEARDFTGEAVVECEWAEPEGDGGRASYRTRSGFVRDGSGPAAVLRPPVFLGFLEESRFRDAAVQDLNGNGRRDDRFAVAMFRDASGEWVVVVDRDGDGDVSGEEVHRSYAKDLRPLRLAGHDPARNLAPVSMALHIEAPEEGPKRVEFHIPTGSHGTHVAGIAAGYRLNGVEGRDGIAPGARVMSLKIGDNRLAGGATVTESMKRALEFAGRWAREHRTPVVVNMSYGVGSELEGEADIEKFVNRFAEENPRVVMVFSAGNGGPGLSTVGSPAAAMHAISVGAVVGPRSARDLIGADASGMQVFHFSARGGELAKPDVCAPGIASSSVPYWEKADLFRGTSMAAPQVAGAAALLISAAEAGKVAWSFGMVKRAMVASATPLPGYGPLEVGGGLVDVSAAHRRLLEMARDPASRWVVGYEVRVRSPTGPRPGGSAAFLRAGGWAPDEAHPMTIRVQARFAADAPGDVKADGYRSFRLTSDAGWVHLSKNSIYLKGEGETTADLFVDPRAVSAPGVHTALVRACSGPDEFRIPVTVVTPHRPSPLDGIPTIRVSPVLRPGEVARIPFRAPAGAETLQATIEPTKDRRAAVYVFLFDGQGRRVPVPEPIVASEEGRMTQFSLSRGDGLGPDTYEMVLYAVPTSRFQSAVDVTLRFHFLRAEPVKALRIEPGQMPVAMVEAVQAGDVPFVGTARGAITGYRALVRKSVSGDALTEGFHLSPGIRAVEFELTMSAEDYARFTDIAVTIADEQGRALVKSGFGARTLRLRLDNPDPGRADVPLRLEVRGGRAFAGGPAFELEVKTAYLWRQPVSLAGTLDGQERFTLFPGVPARLEFRAGATLPAIPPGAVWHGSIEFVADRDRLVWLRVPIEASPR